MIWKRAVSSSVTRTSVRAAVAVPEVLRAARHSAASFAAGEDCGASLFQDVRDNIRVQIVATIHHALKKSRLRIVRSPTLE
jgi:hypothetical protein